MIGLEKHEKNLYGRVWIETILFFFRGDHVVMQRRWQNGIQNAEKQNLKLI